MERWTIQMGRPSIVSDVIDVGLHGRIGLLRDDPSRVLKFCNPKNEDAVNALEQEKRILSILGPHPYITHLHWVSEEGLCFEYYPLGSLRSYYETLRPRLPYLRERMRWCHQTVDAVAYIHSKSVIHNDISARNVLLSSSMDVKICDFEFSNMDGETLIGGGETRYCRGRPLSEFESCVMDDLFGIESLFYEILIGYRPYDTEDSSETRKRSERRLFPSTEEVRPESYGRIINRCWNEEYASILDVRNDLLTSIIDEVWSDC
jgi:serine/threonine protein kinase